MFVLNCLSSIRQRGFVIIALTIICVTCGFTVIDAVSPNGIRSSGLDCWNYAEQCARLKSLREKDKDFVCKFEEMKQRTEEADRIAISLCYGQITVNDAIGLIQTLVQNSVVQNAEVLRTNYICAGYLRPEAAERDTFVCYLLRRILCTKLTAELNGAETLAAFFSDRLIHIYEEVKAQSPGVLPTILTY